MIKERFPKSIDIFKEIERINHPTLYRPSKEEFVKVKIPISHDCIMEITRNPLEFKKLDDSWSYSNERVLEIDGFWEITQYSCMNWTRKEYISYTNPEDKFTDTKTFYQMVIIEDLCIKHGLWDAKDEMVIMHRMPKDHESWTEISEKCLKIFGW